MSDKSYINSINVVFSSPLEQSNNFFNIFLISFYLTIVGYQFYLSLNSILVISEGDVILFEQKKKCISIYYHNFNIQFAERNVMTTLSYLRIILFPYSQEILIESSWRSLDKIYLLESIFIMHNIQPPISTILRDYL